MDLKPIFFNTPMVQSILNYDKTQTRRIVKFPAEVHTILHQGQGVQYLGEDIVVSGFTPEYQHFVIDPEFYIDIKAPYKKGDTLYVRETWAKRIIDDACTGYITQHCPYESCENPEGDCFTEEEYIYRADYKVPENLNIKWRPSIHMPKEAARIFLDVADVRVERLQDISDADILREGIRLKGVVLPDDLSIQCEAYRDAWIDLWNHTCGFPNTDNAWNANPWVWVISFERNLSIKGFDQYGEVVA